MFGINDPSALLRPWKDLKQFSEELYAMHSRISPDEGQTAKSRVSGSSPEPSGRNRVPGVSEAREASQSVRRERIEQAKAKAVVPEQPRRNGHESSGPRAAQGDSWEPRRKPEPPPEPVAQAGGTRPRNETATRSETARARKEWEPSQPPEYRKRAEPEPTKAGQPRRATSAGFDASLFNQESATRKEDQPEFTKIPFGPTPMPAGGGGGATTFLGKIVSGTGDTYQVDLYPNGPSQSKGDTVEAVVPMIDKSDTVPAGTWVSPVFFFAGDGDQIPDSYSFQPPVWLS